MATVAQLNDRWADITAQAAHTSAPDVEIDKISKFDLAWYEAQRGSLSTAQLDDWAKRIEVMAVYVAGLAARYPYKKGETTKTGTGTTTSLPGAVILGDVPWWYWPLRVATGVIGGWFIYRTLRPAHQGMVLAGTKDLHNPEGLTYNEWLRAARKANDYYGLSKKRRAELRSAWKRGEDPTEWVVS